MNKKLIIAGLFALFAGAVFAAPVKKSKAVVLRDSEMTIIKGKGTITIWVWEVSNQYWVSLPGGSWQPNTINGDPVIDGNTYQAYTPGSGQHWSGGNDGYWTGGYAHYVLSQQVDSGPNGQTITHVLGGPQDGVYYTVYNPGS